MSVSSQPTSDATPASSNISFERERGVYGLEVLSDAAHAIVEVGEDELRSSRVQQVFRVLADADIAIFLIKMHRSTLTFAFSGADREKALNLLNAAGHASDVRGDLTLFVVRAATMRDLHGIMVNIADGLFTAGALLHETGDSHNSVQCLVESPTASAVVEELCKKFNLNSESVHYYTLSSGAPQ